MPVNHRLSDTGSDLPDLRAPRFSLAALTGRRGELLTISGTVEFDGTRLGAISATWNNLAGRRVTAELTGRPLHVRNGLIYAANDPVFD